MSDLNSTIRASTRTLQAFWVALSSLSALLVSLLSVIILARYLDKENMGAFKQVTLIYTVLVVIFLGGLPAAYSYFLPRISLGEGRALVSRISWGLFALGCLFGLLLHACSPAIALFMGNPGLSSGLQVFALIPPLLFPALGLNSILTTYGRNQLLAVFTVVTRTLTLLLMILPVIIFGGGYLLSIYGWVLASVITLILSLWIQRKVFGEVSPEKPSVGYIDIFRYGLPLIAAGFCGAALRASDQFYVSREFGVEIYAVYATAMIELPFVVMVKGAVTAVLLPAFSRMHSQGEAAGSFFDVWDEVLRKSALLIYPLSTFCMIFASEIVELLFTSQYSDGANYFRLGIILSYFDVVAFAPLVLAIGGARKYAAGHMYAALLAWVGGYLVVGLTHKILLIALYFVLVKAALVIYFVWYLSKDFKIRTTQLLPLRWMLGLFIFLGSCALMAAWAATSLGIISPVYRLFFCSLLYGGITVSIGKLIGFDFLRPLRPLFNRSGIKG